MSFRVIALPPQTLMSWWDEKDDIDFDPVYQRKGHIWAVKQRQDLVDTVLNGFDIPKLYLADFTLLDSDLNEKARKFAVIDGKQRLEALFGFFEGEIVLAKSFTFFDEPTLSLGGLSYDDLVSNYPKIARRYSNYSLSIMSVITDDEAKISELFLRLNTSKPLTGAEIRNAMLGEVPSLIRELVEHNFWTKTKFNTLRGQDKNTAAKLLLLEHSGSFVDTKKRQLDLLVAEAQGHQNGEESDSPGAEGDDSFDDADTDDLIDSFADASAEAEYPNIRRSADRVLVTLDRLSPLFIPNDPVLSQQAQIPVIYWLGRELASAQLSAFREFLVYFETQRQANRQLTYDDPRRDVELVEFEMMARTSNDQASIAGRYTIMRKRLFSFLDTRVSTK